MFLDNKDDYVSKIKEYQFFSMGKYLTLYIFKLIIERCQYINKLKKTDLFKDKDFIRNNIVKKWLPIILDELMKKEFIKYQSNSIGIIKSFYASSQTHSNIEKKFNTLDMEKNQEFKELFPINIS